MGKSFAAALATCFALGLATPAGADPGASIGDAVSGAIHAGGPIFTPRERALIIAKCGYPATYNVERTINISNGTFHCANGRKVNDPQMRAMLAEAQPRIAARISTAMSSPAVQQAISRQVTKSVTEALSGVFSSGE